MTAWLKSKAVYTKKTAQRIIREGVRKFGRGKVKLHKCRKKYGICMRL